MFRNISYVSFQSDTFKKNFFLTLLKFISMLEDDATFDQAVNGLPPDFCKVSNILMCVLLHLLICTALRAHTIVVEALYKINYYYYYYYHYIIKGNIQGARRHVSVCI